MKPTGQPVASAAQLWRDLGALLAPAGCAPGPPAAEQSLDWPGIYRLAAAHLVSPSLYAVLDARGRLDAVPVPVRDALAELHRLNAARNARLRAVLHDTVRLLNAAGIEPLLLKGAIALLPDQYPQAGARMMSDLDLALYNAEAEQGEAVLRAAGYRDADNVKPAGFRCHHHLAPLFHPNGDAYVELHRSILTSRAPAAVLSLAQVRAAAQPITWMGKRLWVPAPAHRLLHNALHQQVQDDVFRSHRRSLRQLHEFAQLRALPTAAAIDWPELLAPLDALGLGEAVRAYLLASARLFGQPLPPSVQPGRAARRAERRFWFFVAHPRLLPHYNQARRLRNLPRRLITPGWLPAKMRYLGRQWFPDA